MYDIKVCPNGYIICDKKHGYNYLHIKFLDITDILTDEDECEIITRMVKAFKGYMEERMEKIFKDHMEYEKHANDVMEANLGEEYAPHN